MVVHVYLNQVGQKSGASVLEVLLWVVVPVLGAGLDPVCVEPAPDETLLPVPAVVPDVKDPPEPDVVELGLLCGLPPEHAPSAHTESTKTARMNLLSISSS